MTSKAGRAAYAIKSGTVAAGVAVGNTLAYVSPQLAGAIDIVVVRQPDGSLKSSPFYVRFGKYTGLRSDPTKVSIFLNEKEADFCMHMGRTGEAYFLVDAEPGSQGQFPEALNGLLSPVSGYSSDQEPSAFAAQQSPPGAAQAGGQPGHLRHASSTPALPEARPPAPPQLLPGPAPGRAHAHAPGLGLDSTLSCPASLTPPQAAARAPRLMASEAGEPSGAAEDGGEWPWPAARPLGQAARQRGWSTGQLQALAAAPGGRLTGGGAGSREGAVADAPAAAAPAGAGPGPSRSSSSSSSLGLEDGMFSPLRPAAPSGGSSPLSAAGSPAPCWDARAPPPAASGGDARQQGGSPPPPSRSSGLSSAQSRPPQHPWSVGNPRLLPSVLAAQPQPAVLSSADAAAPVQGAAAGQGGGQAAPTAILPRRSLDEGAGDVSRPRVGGRAELEALEARVPRQPVPLAMAAAAHDLHRWQQQEPAAGPSKGPPAQLEVAQAIDRLAEQQSRSGPRSRASHASSPEPRQPPAGSAPQAVSAAASQPPESAFSAAAQGGGLGGGAEQEAGGREQLQPQPLQARQGSLGAAGFGSAIDLETAWPGGDAPARPLEPFAEEPAAGQGPPGGSPAASPGLHGRASLAGEAASSSLPIGIPGGSGRKGELALGLEQQAERPLGGSLPAGAFGMSPTQSARYLGNTCDRAEERLPSGSGSSAAPPQGVELSLCASRLLPSMSPQEAWQAFECGRVGRAQFESAAAELTEDPELVCRLGRRLLPWRLAAPVLLGAAVFGCQLERLLQAGLPVEPPAPLPGDAKKEAEKRGGWRVWLTSWRSRRDSGDGGGLGAAAAAAVAAADAQPPAAGAQAAAGPGSAAAAAEGGTEGMLEAGIRAPRKHRAFCPGAGQLAGLQLKEGQNIVEFVYGKQRLRAYLYHFRWDARLVISDVDGTITRSDLLGHLLPRVGWDWSHPGVSRFFTQIGRNGYHILFLSSRAIAQASATRDYLHSLTQDGHKLPCGPVIISPDGLFPSLYRELVLRRPHEFKIRALEDIRALFPPACNPYYCGFGNRDTDEISYLTVGVPAERVFTINPRGELRQASSAVVTSTWNSLTRIVDIVDEIFPPCGGEVAPRGADATPPRREEFSDFNYWHVAPPIIVDSEDEVFGEGLGDSEEEETASDEDAAEDGAAASVGFRAWP